MCALSVGSLPCHAQKLPLMKIVDLQPCEWSASVDQFGSWRWPCDWVRESTLLIVLDRPRFRSWLIVFEGVGMDSLLARGLAMGRLLAWRSLGSTGLLWLEEATALPRVGLLDSPWCRCKAEKLRWHTAADKHHPHCQSRPSPTFFVAGRSCLKTDL